DTHAFTPPGEDEIRTLVTQYAGMIQNLRDPLNSGGTAGRRLAEILLSPAAGLTPTGSRATTAPAGGLHGLNYETLPVGPSGQEHYWIADVTVSIAPSLNVLAAAPARQRSGNRLLLIGDPAAADPQFEPLPHAGEEVENIRRHFAAL